MMEGQKEEAGDEVFIAAGSVNTGEKVVKPFLLLFCSNGSDCDLVV